MHDCEDYKNKNTLAREMNNVSLKNIATIVSCHKFFYTYEPPLYVFI